MLQVLQTPVIKSKFDLRTAIWKQLYPFISMWEPGSVENKGSETYYF